MVMDIGYQYEKNIDIKSNRYNFCFNSWSLLLQIALNLGIILNDKSLCEYVSLLINVLIHSFKNILFTKWIQYTFMILKVIIIRKIPEPTLRTHQGVIVFYPFTVGHPVPPSYLLHS